MSPRRVKIRLLCTGALLAAWSLGCGCDRQDRPSPQLLRARWHNNQGVAYMDQHNYTRGREEFARAVALDSGYATGLANLGIAYYSLGKYDSALVALQKALKLDPAHLHARYTLGLIYHTQGREYDKALRAFAAVAAADPDDPQVHYFLGQIHAKMGQARKAIEQFQRAIHLDPYNVSAYYALALQYRQLGQQDKWQQTLATFSKLRRAGHETINSSYQGQGKYAEALPDGSAHPGRDDAVGPFHFAAPLAPPAHFPEAPNYATALDYDRDGDPDLLAGGGLPALYRNDGGSFVSIPGLRVHPGAQTGESRFADAAFADIDNDSDPDLVLSGEHTLLLRNEGELELAPTTELGGPARRGIFADLDHDGDLDLLLLRRDGCRLLANDGTGAFEDISARAGVMPGGQVRQAAFSDFDNDRDLDFVAVGPDSLWLYTNNRDGTFSDIAPSLGLSAAAGLDLWVEDFDQDGYMDLCLAGADGTLALYLNHRGRSFAARTLPALSRVEGLQAADFDNDGDLDLLAYGGGGIHLLAHHGEKFQPQAPLLDAAVRQVLVADFDGDGAADIWADGRLLRNQRREGHWIEVQLQGRNSNREGIGAKVEVKTPHRQQKREVRGGGRDARVLRFGLAAADSVEFVRVLWPSGVRQTELASAADRRISIAELDRKGTSCPILYAWDGERFRFVTDILGGAIIGYLTAPGQYSSTDTDEYIPLGKLAPRAGRYVLQLADQLEEIVYLDAAELVAVDHPGDVEVYPNERLLASPPYPEFRLYPLRNLRPLRGARDGRGADIAPLLRAIDDQWYEGFELEAIHGYAREYSLTLDLGDFGAGEHPVLLAYGWVDYAHSSSNWAASQQGLELHPPRLEVPDGRGGWMTASADMGCPAGLPKHMLVDLQGLIPGADHRLRITTNTAIYWDQFLVGSVVPVPLRTHRLAVEHSDLHWRGYPAHTAIRGTFAFRYHYDQLRTEAPWGTHGGAFTRFGEVSELLQAADDRYVIMAHGDELTLEFAAADLPSLEPGYERTFLLYADGFGKDMDFHSAHSLTVAPLPFHRMSSYPYAPGENYPEAPEYLEYLLEYNTRWIKGYYE